MKCHAKADGDDWRVNGMKHFISHGDIADFFIVFIATGEEQTNPWPEKTDYLLSGGSRYAGVYGE